MSFRRLVMPNDSLMEKESLIAYSRDASEVKGTPQIVLRPRTLEQVRRIILHCYRTNVPLVARGSGTGLRGGAVRGESCLLHTMHLQGIAIDTQLRQATIGAGVTVGRLNKELARHQLRFPLLPEQMESTLGGLAAINMITEESHKHGDFHDLVLKAECFDGAGRHHTLKGERLKEVIGWEGTTGIITKLTVKLERIQPLSVDLLEMEDLPTIMEGISAQALLVEYVGNRAAERMDIGGEKLLIAYEGGKGSYKNPVWIERALGTRKSLPVLMRKEGLALEEATLDESQMAAFIKLCEEEEYVLFGHLSAGVLTAAVPTSDRINFRNRIVSLGGRPYGKYGFGRSKREWVPEGTKGRLRRLKERWDYHNILNPGVII